MVPTLIGVESIPSGLVSLEFGAADVPLSDIASGDVPPVPNVNMGWRPLSLPALRESGAFPVNASELRARRQARGQAEMAAALSLGGKTLNDTRGERLLAAYRLLTSAARVTGDLPTGPAMLASLPSAKFFLPSPSRMDGTSQGLLQSFYCFKEVSSRQTCYSFIVEGELKQASGITLLPPPIPDSAFGDTDHFRIADYRTKGAIPEGYAPARDEMLTLWIAGMSALSDFLGVERGTQDAPAKGYYGLLGLLNPATARMAWPSRDDILNFEQELLFYTSELIEGRGRRASTSVERQIMEDFGFTHIEALLTVRTAGMFMGGLYAEEPEDIRHREARILDGIYDVCMDAGDPRAGLAAQKHKHQLLGLTKQDESESMREFRDTAKRVLSEEEDDF